MAKEAGKASSAYGGVTIPAKDLKRQNIVFGDEVEVIVRPLNRISSEDQRVLDSARKILNDYKKKISRTLQIDEHSVFGADA